MTDVSHPEIFPELSVSAMAAMGWEALVCQELPQKRQVRHWSAMRHKTRGMNRRASSL